MQRRMLGRKRGMKQLYFNFQIVKKKSFKKIEKEKGGERGEREGRERRKRERQRVFQREAKKR